MPDSAGRQTYLLSLWREAPDAPWRAALRRAGSDERLGFADLEALALFLLRLDTGGERPTIRIDHTARPSATAQPAHEIDNDMINDTTIR